MTITSGSSIFLRRILQSSGLGVRKYSSSTREFKEIKIAVPWGHVVGKWYGRTDTRPLVGFHGQRNNAGTFDAIAPLLPSHLGFLSIDLPGHGLSSWLPDGCVYNVMDYITLMHRLMDEFKWDKISMMCHSMSVVNGFTFAGLYPDKCDLLIGLDVLKIVVPPLDESIEFFKGRLEAFNKLDKKNRDQKTPSYYAMDELVQKLHEGSEKSISKESCELLLKRSIKQSPEFPNKYRIHEDQRLKALLFYFLPQHIIVDIANRITCPYLCIKSKQSSYYEDMATYNEVLNALKQKPNFEYHEVDGTHHFHINDPKKTADIVNPFIMKYRPE